MAWLNSTVLSFRFLSYRQEKICREGSAIQLAWKCAQTVSTHLLSNHFVSERSEGVVWFFLFRKKHVTSSKLDTAWQTHRSPMEQLWVTTGEMSHIMYLRFSSIAASIHLNFEKCKMFDQILGSLLLLYKMSHSATWKGNMPKWAATSSALLWRIEGFRQCLGFEVLFESQHFYLNYPGRQGLRTAPRIESIGPSDLKDVEHGKNWKKIKRHQSFQNEILWICCRVHHKLLKIQRVYTMDLDHSTISWYIPVRETTPCLKCPLAWLCWHKNIWCLCHLKHGEHHSWMSTLLCWIWCLSSRTIVFFGQTWHLGSHAVACHCHTQGVHSVHCAHSRHRSHVENWNSLPDLSTASSTKTSTMTSWTAIFHWLSLAVNVLKMLTHFCNLWTLWTGWLRWWYGALRLDRVCLCL